VCGHELGSHLIDTDAYRKRGKPPPCGYGAGIPGYACPCEAFQPDERGAS
jgi:hypothetical protein